MGRKHKESIGRLQQAAHVKPTKHTSAARKHRPNWQTIRMKTLRRKKNIYLQTNNEANYDSNQIWHVSPSYKQ